MIYTPMLLLISWWIVEVAPQIERERHRFSAFQRIPDDLIESEMYPCNESV